MSAKLYKFATDSESGSFQAKDFAHACARLDAMIADTEGGFGWVQDHDGYRYEVAGDPETQARVTAAYERLARVLGIR